MIPGRRIDKADGVVLGIDDQKIACPIDRQFLGPVECRLRGRAAVARVAFARPCRQLSRSAR